MAFLPLATLIQHTSSSVEGRYSFITLELGTETSNSDAIR